MKWNAVFEVRDKSSHLLIFVFVVLLLITLFSNALFARGGDFPVFWHTAGYLLSGEPIYSLARDGVECFKYPPWLAEVLAPLAFFDEITAGIVWRLSLVSSAVYLMAETCRISKSFKLSLLMSLLFWGFWVNNIVSGQITLHLFVFAWLGFQWIEQRSARSGFGWVLLFFGLTAKVFHVFALFGLKVKPRMIDVLFALMALFILTLPTLFSFDGVLPMIAAFQENAGSGQDNLGGGLYGLPTLFAQWFGLPILETKSRLIGFIPSVGLVFVLMAWARKHIERSSELFVLSLALSAVIHPLTFAVALIWVYPLTVLAVKAAVSSKSVLVRCLTGVGIVFVIFMNSKASIEMGLDLPQFPSVKAVGVLMLSAAFVLSQNQRKKV